MTPNEFRILYEDHADCGHCEKPMASGLVCHLPEGHDGPCFDKFGLRDPLPCAEVSK